MKALTRTTKETNITAKLNLYGNSKSSIDTGIGFFNHMLDSFVRHSLIDLELQCKGDIEVDYHHSVEDCGIVIGELLHQSLYPVGGIERFGHASIVMDEACVECSIDVSNRAFFVFEAPLSGKIGTFDAELIEEFFKALVFNANLSAHIIYKRGKNLHHISEAVFKSFAVAFRNAIKPNDRIILPTTKGIL
ncbi:imidazoleglycerol-phosphate dehydratase HisB [Helicobacter sp. MIT 99-5507]|uniref:imidazoleglycerol-phosphate dehydratase HisB n=1 Tax=Helicobacter sp. MIT 99-5507 TaxID=152489 RepID=UPI000E1E3476|nr:imidazoleglycerol-phosphate dehydratase HisB [Helicobacter sp. MIT 99-5507]RDU57881.1 imidazoleglycerol-phosphate dehydratase HisB [Helicobacter sp. MIT 99-5507]